MTQLAIYGVDFANRNGQSSRYILEGAMKNFLTAGVI